MPDLSHDTAEDGFHEIQLSGKQLVFLFIVTTSVVVGVFLFGVLVGRGARDARPEEQASTATATPAPAPDAGLAPAPDPAPADSAAAPPEPVVESSPTYHQELTGAGQPKEASRPAPAPEAAPAPPKAEPERKTPEPAAPAPAAAAAKGSVPPGIPTSGRPGTWRVQVMATRDQAVATSVVRKLIDKGYPAFLIPPAADAPQAFYKVQVGRYNDRGEAQKVSQRIEKEEQFPSWILR